ncbi:MAG: trypsin-like peptidase domain-containing protein, partial [Spirochaetes bacterium]|nr:trypsin-like peptidase domain-containing protein [Spirochaetota bacterium]
GRSLDMSLGDRIYTIGNPLGIKYTVTSGIISNKEIDFFQLGRAFQIDAAINPGNSGGPLIDERGQVVGIVFAGIPQFEGISFVIPFQWVRKTIPALYRGGEVKRCWIGAALYNEDDKVFFYYILPNGPANKAGILVKDRLLKIDGVDVKTVEDAQALLAWRRYPRLIQIETERDGKRISSIVKLEERPYLPVEVAFERDTEGNIITLIYGIGLEYYDKSFIFKKYKTTKIYKGMYGFELNIGEGDRIVIYDLRYIEKNKFVKLTLKFKQKDLGIIDRIVTVVSPVEINSIL